MGKFKVGDRVRLIKSDGYNGYGEYGKTGEEGAVVQYTDYDDNYEVDFDESGRWWAYADNLEPVAVAPQPQLTIRAGAYYKTRDGRKVGPMEDNGDTAHDTDEALLSYRVDGAIRLWRVAGGKHLFGDANLDLIAEWADEPAFKVGDRVVRHNYLGGDDCFGTVSKVTEVGVFAEDWSVGCRAGYMHAEDLRLVAPATSGKFKVGDKVRILSHENNNGDQIKKDLPIGSVHTINKITDQIPGVQCCILSGSDVYFYTPKDLELVTASSPAIVALIENGQPKPATRPFVHPDRDSAAKEARRLAGRHKGKEFGVYELVDTAKEAKVYEHEWQRLAAGGRKIDAIKRVREATGFTLRGAKYAVEHWLAVEAA